MDNNFIIGETLFHKKRKQYCLYIGTKGCFDDECLVQFTDEYNYDEVLRVSIDCLERTNDKI